MDAIWMANSGPKCNVRTLLRMRNKGRGTEATSPCSRGRRGRARDAQLAFARTDALRSYGCDAAGPGRRPRVSPAATCEPTPRNPGSGS